MYGSSKLTAAALAVLCGVSACGAAKDAAAPPAPEVAVVQTPIDPFAWKDVRYQEYRTAALQVPISAELLVQPAALTASLETLCRTDAAGFAALIAEHETRAKEAGDNDLETHLDQEVALRLGMACAQRMGDWLTAQRDADPAEDAGSGAADTSTTEVESSNSPSRVETPQEVEGEKLPENPYVESSEEDVVPASVAGGGGGS
ncbi:MAG: hypothetical protein ACT4QF_18700 [Sporichthyaceae bacterium]